MRLFIALAVSTLPYLAAGSDSDRAAGNVSARGQDLAAARSPTGSSPSGRKE
jgi:hypothetical protein